MFSKTTLSEPIALPIREGGSTVEGTDVRVNKDGNSQTARQTALSYVDRVYLGDRAPLHHGRPRPYESETGTGCSWSPHPFPVGAVPKGAALFP